MNTTLKKINHTDISKTYSIATAKNTYIPILPWGSIEPHGEHLPYLTDSILAEEVSNAVADLANEKLQSTLRDELKGKILNCVVLPTLSMGSQNPSQLEYPFCIHFNTETQKKVLEDIVVSLQKQEITRLFIINGHNGNTLKSIIRDLGVKYPDFNIYLCNYLDVVDYVKWIDEKLIRYELDDHAAYTETSLMLHVHPELVHLEHLPFEEENVGKPNDGCFWKPRDWADCSVNTRVGTVGMASGQNGKTMFDYVAEKLSNEIVNICR